MIPSKTEQAIERVWKRLVEHQIRAEAAHNATIAKSAPLRRYYQNEFADGTTIGNITSYSAGFERGIIARAVAYDTMLAEEISNQ